MVTDTFAYPTFEADIVPTSPAGACGCGWIQRLTTAIWLTPMGFGAAVIQADVAIGGNVVTAFTSVPKAMNIDDDIRKIIVAIAKRVLVLENCIFFSPFKCESIKANIE